MSRHLLLGLTICCAVLVTLGVALGGHLQAWEFYVWVWTAVAWAIHWHRAVR
jgi:hypothetical protein